MKLIDLISKADAIEINMERADCYDMGDGTWRFHIDEESEVWNVDAQQEVELSNAGCVMAKLSWLWMDDDDSETEVEICFMRTTPLTKEDFR